MKRGPSQKYTEGMYIMNPKITIDYICTSSDTILYVFCVFLHSILEVVIYLTNIKPTTLL